MPDLAARLAAVLADLDAHPDVAIVCAHVAPPASAAALDAIEERLGPLDPDLRAFYLHCNGLSICWQSLPRTEERHRRARQDDPIWYFEDSEGGHIIVEPIEEVFGPRMADHDIREIAAEGYWGEPVSAFGDEHDPEEFFETMWVISWFYENNAVLVSTATTDDDGRAALVVQGDQGLESKVQPGLTFGSWLDFLLRTWGHTGLQRDIHRNWTALQRHYTLDELTAAD